MNTTTSHAPDTAVNNRGAPAYALASYVSQPQTIKNFVLTAWISTIPNPVQISGNLCPGLPQIPDISRAIHPFVMLKVGQTETPKLNILGGLQIHVAQYQPTERPIEDRFSVDLSDDGTRLVIGVYDGHGGPETADHICKTLPPRLLAHLPNSHAQQFEELDNSMISDFEKDLSFFHRRSLNWVHNAQLMKSGSAALIVDVNLLNLSATYANGGDCRLIAIDPNAGDRGSLQLETNDLNVKTESERERIIREHPKEDHIIVGGRLFGRLMCTRGEISIVSSALINLHIQVQSSFVLTNTILQGFGDGYYKFSKGLFGDSQHRKYIDAISSIERKGKISMKDQYASMFYAYKTPPYITARPETANFQLENGNLVILATDGLWDLISSEDAKSIIVRGLENDKDDLAKYLLDAVKCRTPPGDDVTIVVFRVGSRRSTMKHSDT